jgi:uncharacterized protein YkwD
MLMPIVDRRARRLCLACLIGLVLLNTTIGAAHPARSRSLRLYLPAITATPSAGLIEQQVVELTNQERLLNGCLTPLTLSSQLSAAARGHSQDMALRNFFSHTGSDGSTMVDRIQRAGYAYTQAAENIAAGQATASEVVASWMSSDSHRVNILNCALREIGVGYYDDAGDQPNVRGDDGSIGGPYRYYWTQDFGTQ